MTKQFKKLIAITAIFCSCNFLIFSQETKTFNTVTEALNYKGNDKIDVTKIIICYIAHICRIKIVNFSLSIKKLSTKNHRLHIFH